MPDLLKTMVTAAKEAGDVLLHFYHKTDLEITIKQDNSPVTEADLAADKAIRKILTKANPYPVLSEEEEIPYDMRKNWKEYWLIDPLDGTKDFIRKTGEFTVNIALMRENEPVLGLIYAPYLGETYVAEKNKGATFIQDSQKEKLPLYHCEGKILVRSRFHDSDIVQKFAEQNNITESIPVGAALKFGRLATGKASLYLCSYSYEWDLAAGHLLVKESGGSIIMLNAQKKPLYNKPDLLNPPFLAFNKDIEVKSLII